MLFYKRWAVQIALRYESSRVALYVVISYSFLRLMRYCYEKGMEGLSVKVGMGAVCGIAKVAYSGYWHNVCSDIDTEWNFTHFCVLGVARMREKDASW